MQGMVKKYPYHEGFLYKRRNRENSLGFLCTWNIRERGNVMFGGANNMEYTVSITWDEEANVWIAISNDIPGLVLESGSYDDLIDRLKIAIPEILEANHLPKISLLNYISERHQGYANG